MRHARAEMMQHIDHTHVERCACAREELQARSEVRLLRCVCT